MKNLIAFSFLIGVIGIILLGMNLTLLFYHTETSIGKIATLFYRVTKELPFFARIILEGGVGFSFMLFLFLSPFGIFLATKSLNSSHRRLATFAILLNSINLIFSLFIAWLLFGLARGM